MTPTKKAATPTKKAAKEEGAAEEKQEAPEEVGPDDAAPIVILQILHPRA
jgi:hypothetical protein